MRRWIGLLLILALAGCQDTTQWLEAVEEPALSFKEQQLDTLAQRLQKPLPREIAANLPFTAPGAEGPEREQVFVMAGPVWQGLTLPHAARLILGDRNARGAYALFHVPMAADTVAAALQQELEQEGWQLLEVMTSNPGQGPRREYLSFWQNQLSFLPQQLFVTACALVQEETTKLAVLELSMRCTGLRQKAITLGVGAPDSAQATEWNVVDMGTWLTHVPYAWHGSTPHAQSATCSATGNLVCLYQRSLVRDGSTLTLRLLAVSADTPSLALHPAHVLDISQSLAQDALPLLLQPVVLQSGVSGIQLYALAVSGNAPIPAVRSEIHFLQDQRYMVFEGTLSGLAAREFSQGPMLSQILQQVAVVGTTE